MDVGCWMDVGWMDGWMDGCWMVGESGIKANSAQFSWSLAELGKKYVQKYDQSTSKLRPRRTEKVIKKQLVLTLKQLNLVAKLSQAPAKLG